MKYSREETQRMDRVVEVFSDYLAGGAAFDIAYSERLGFVKLINDPGSEQFYFFIDSLQELLEIFFFEIGLDTVYDAKYKGLYLAGEKMDFSDMRRSIYPLLERLGPDKDYALDLLDNCLASWPSQNILP